MYTTPMTKMTLSEELQWRGFTNQTTYSDISKIDGDPITFYWGVDPSSSSMTIGNLAIAMMVMHFIKAGHKAILLVGGATGLIGDPDGKAEERILKTTDEIELNKKGINAQYKQVFGDLSFKMVDNYDWFKDLNYLQFLRDVGKHVPMRQMLNRDFVQTRLNEGGAGVSYAEFSYSLIQGYDFMHLNSKHDVTLQVCGSDQWGNSIAGVDIIRRKTGKEAHVWSAPLVINKATGKKFGKTEDGAVWLDPNMTSVFKFYQFWLNVDDEGVEDYLKVYTLLDKAKIDSVVADFAKDKSSRLAQKTLAYEVTKVVHGQDKANSVKKVSKTLFGGGAFTDLLPEDIKILKQELKCVPLNDDIAQTVLDAGLAQSKGEATRFIESGAISVNGVKVTGQNDKPFTLETNLLKRGKNSFALVATK